MIDFEEDKTPGLSNTVASNLLRTDQASYNNSIADSEGKSNSFGENSSKKVDDGSRAALKKSDKEYREKVKAEADEKVAKTTAKAEAKYEKKTETAKAKLKAEYRTDTTFSEASDAGAGMRHTNGRYKVRNEDQVNANLNLLRTNSSSSFLKLTPSGQLVSIRCIRYRTCRYSPSVIDIFACGKFDI